MELLAGLIKSDIRGCMMKMLVKDVVDVIAGAPKMLARVLANNSDELRAPLRASVENRNASGDGQASIRGGGGGFGEEAIKSLKRKLEMDALLILDKKQKFEMEGMELEMREKQMQAIEKHIQ